jgi:hypothetical protein
MGSYVLNHNQQANGDYEVHKRPCSKFPTSNFEELGEFSECSSAVATAKLLHPSWHRINGCAICCAKCHTS